MIALLAFLLVCQDPAPVRETAAGPELPAVFSVDNLSVHDRDETVLASVPLPRGHRDVRSARIVGRLLGPLSPVGQAVPVEANSEGPGDLVPARPLVLWPDGSVAVLQAQVRVRIPPRSRLVVRIEPVDGGVPATDAAAGFAFEAPLPLFTEVEDPWGTRYRARLEADPAAGPDGVISETGRVRVRRFRSVHRRVDGDPSGFLGLRAYLVSFAGERRAVLTLVLDNGPQRFGRLGPVRLRSFALVTESDDLRFRPRFAVENALPAPAPRDGGGYRQQLLGPGSDLYLGDNTAKAFRFDLFLDHESVTGATRSAAKAAGDAPLRPLPDLEWVRATGAFGAHGGPAPLTELREDLSLRQLAIWRRTAVFGPFGGFGDPADAAVQGSARNGPSALHNVVRWSSSLLLEAAEGMVLQHALRPTPGHRVALPDDTAPFRQGLGERAIRSPHGFTALDYEHFSVDLLYDYYWLTGDPLARDELARAGAGLRPLLEGLPFMTCRGEGWTLQAGVLIGMATGDRTLIDYLHRRFTEQVLPRMGDAGTGYVLRQPPHPEALGATDSFDAPWQIAALVHGLHALFRATGDPAIAAAAARAAEVMAGPGWVDGEGPKYLMSALDPARYTMPVGYGPTMGTALLQTGAFVLAGELTGDQQLRELFGKRAEFILQDHVRPGTGPRDRWVLGSNPWLQIALDRGVAGW